MSIYRASVNVTIPTGDTSGSGVSSQIAGKLLAVIFVLPDGAPVGAQYQIYQTSPEITLLEVSGQQIALRGDSLFCPRKLADSQDGQPIGGGDIPFPTTIPLYSSVGVAISDAIAGTYVVYLLYDK